MVLFVDLCCVACFCGFTVFVFVLWLLVLCGLLRTCDLFFWLLCCWLFWFDRLLLVMLVVAGCYVVWVCDLLFGYCLVGGYINSVVYALDIGCLSLVVVLFDVMFGLILVSVGCLLICCCL